MAASLTASFVLKLEDKLSSGIASLTKKLEGLAALAQKLKFEGLQQAGGAMDKVGAAADKVSRKVEGIGRSARSAIGELKRLSSQPIMVNMSGTAFLPPSVSRAAMAATMAAAAATAGGGRLPALPSGPSASFFSTPTLQLAGPGGGIPLAALNPAVSRMNALAGAASAARAQFGQVAGYAGQLNHHLREAGHGALGALTTGFGLFEPVREYAAYENVLRHIAITANTPQAELPKVIGELTKQYNVMALSTGQAAEKVAESANFLITTGIGRKAVDAMLPVVAQAATAYNSPIGDSVQAIFSLAENLHVPHDQLGATVSAMALAGKAGHFSFADMSRFLPDVAPLAGGAGLGGSMGARSLMAMLETSRRNAGTSGEAETNVRDFLSHLFGDPKRGLGHTFASYGVDLNKVLLDAEKKGISAPEAVIEKVRQLTEGKSQYQTNLILGKLFHNQQSAQFARGWLHDMKYYLRLKKELEHADNNTILNDFNKAFDAPQVQLNRLQEALKQIVRRFGEGFAGLVPPITSGLESVIALLDHLDEKMPGTGNKTLGATGGFLGLMAVLGISIPIFRAVGNGFMLLFTPLRWLVSLTSLLARGMLGLVIAGGPVVWVLAAVAGAAALIWANWDKLGPRLQMLLSDLKDSFGQFGQWISGIAEEWLRPFDAFFRGLQDKIEQARRLLGGGGPADTSSRNGRRDRDDSVEPNGQPSLGGVPGLREMLNENPFAATPMSYRPGGGGTIRFAPLDLRVSVDGPAKVEAPRRLEPVDRGQMMDRA